MKIYLSIIILALLVISNVNVAQAVPPPDFIFNIGSQLVQAFAFLVLGFSVIVGALRRFLQTNILFVKYGKITWTVLALLVIGLSLTGAYFYNKQKQDQAYSQWVAESKSQSLQGEEDGLDQLEIGALTPNKINPRGQQPEDPGTTFIKTYYGNLAKGNLEAAYAVSSKTVSLETYKSWYKDTLGLSIDSIQKISDNSYSLGLTLKEKTGTTRYAVLMHLKTGQAGKLSVERSDVRVLAGAESTAGPNASESGATANSQFFEQNSQQDIKISNEDFKNITDNNPNAYVLDAREDEEYEIGNFPGSNHIRFADLKAGEWIRVPQDQVIYVLCWSGIRGKEVTEFLRSKNIVARYLATGADGWVDFGGKWTGGIKFLSKYTAERYQIVFNTDEVKQYVKDGVVMVDSRHPAKYSQRHMPGSISIPIIYTPTSKLEETLSQVPPNSKVITVCDDFVSCFDAKVTGVKLEKRGNIFLGRYNKPWEYTQ